MKPPEKQSNYQQALDHAFAGALSRGEEGIVALGAVALGARKYELKVLDEIYAIDLGGKMVTTGGEDVRLDWKLLALHYISAFYPWPGFARWVSFAEIPEIRGYKPVFDNRVIGRLCSTVGRDRESFVRAGERIGGERLEWGDAGFTFRAFPHLSVGIAWYAGDDELPPGASFIYPDNVTALLPIEDVVVLAEAIVGRLQRAAG